MTPWTVAHQAPLSMELSREEYWSGLPFPSPGDHPNPSLELLKFLTLWSAQGTRGNQSRLIPRGNPNSLGNIHLEDTLHYWHTAVTEGSCPLSASRLYSWSEADMVETGAALGSTGKWMIWSPEPLSSPALSRSAQLPDWKQFLLKT